MDYIIYDCEIVKCLPEQFGTRYPDLEYCAGWEDFANMGISVIGVIDQDGSTKVIIPGKNPDTWKKLLDPTIKIVGFNSKKFDDRLCQANGIEVKTDYDLLEEIRLAAYGSIRWEDQPPGFSYSLARMGQANGFPKTGTGELAPKLWQENRQQEVIDYCLNDVKITRSLLELGWAGQLIDPNTRSLLRLRSLEEVCSS